MKNIIKKLFLFSLIFTSLFFIVKAPSVYALVNTCSTQNGFPIDQMCATHTVTVNVINLPSDKNIYVGCNGDDGNTYVGNMKIINGVCYGQYCNGHYGGTQGENFCKGDIKQVANGGTVVLPHCSCQGVTNGSCLQVLLSPTVPIMENPCTTSANPTVNSSGITPQDSGCTVSPSPLACISNAVKHTSTVNINCPSPTPSPTPVTCGSSCTLPADCASGLNGCTTCVGGVCAAPTPTPSPTPSPTPVTCGSSCTLPADCASGLNGCTTCVGGVCAAPTPTPSPTPIPACGTACTKSADCNGALTCTACIGGVCKQPYCGSPCTLPADCTGALNGCNTCVGGTCNLPPTPTPSPTPIPACGTACTKSADCNGALTCTACIGGVCTAPPVFNLAACTCDGIENTALFTGQNATITSFAKVVGVDTSAAQVLDQKFFLAEGAETMATIIAQSSPIPATVVNTSSTLVKYQSQWQLQMPQLKSGATYRIWSQINCQPKIIASNYSSPRKVVLAAQTSFWEGISNFLNNFINTIVPSNLTGRKTIQLQTVTPVNIYEKTCSFIKFKVGM